MSDDNQKERSNVVGEMFDASNIAAPSSPQHESRGFTASNIQLPSENNGFTVDNVELPVPNPSQEDNDD